MGIRTTNLHYVEDRVHLRVKTSFIVSIYGRDYTGLDISEGGFSFFIEEFEPDFIIGKSIPNILIISSCGMEITVDFATIVHRRHNGNKAVFGVKIHKNRQKAKLAELVQKNAPSTIEEKDPFINFHFTDIQNLEIIDMAFDEEVSLLEFRESIKKMISDQHERLR